MGLLRAFAIAAALLMIAAPASALRVKLGLQGIAINNSLTGDLPREGSWNGQRELGAGIIAEFDLTDDISLSLQPGFTPRNSRREFKRKGEITGYIDYEVDYLSVPLLVRVTGDPIGVRGFVTAGLDFSFRLEARLDVRTEIGPYQEEITDTFKPSSFGALFGAGAMIPVDRHFVILELRYVQGLSDIVERNGDEEDSFLSSPSIKYKGLEFVVGFAFTLGGGR